MDSGDRVGALDALENLLTLGPSNTEALKMKAYLMESSGRFDAEYKIWQRILEIDDEDQEALDYLFRRQMEDREHFHFTEKLKTGGRRFHAYPKGLLGSSIYMIGGVTLFLVLARAASVFTPLQNWFFAVMTIIVCLFGPIFYLAYQLLFTLKSVEVDQNSFRTSTRFKRRELLWSQIKQITLCQVQNPNLSESLGMIVIPKDEQSKAIHINLDTYEATIRARNYFLRDISEHHEISYDIDFKELSLSKKDIQSY